MRYGLVMIAAAAAALGACSLSADYNGSNFSCKDNAPCPDNYTCIDEVCEPSTPPPSACATTVGAGVNHMCVIRDDGTAWCSGANTNGQLGDGTTTDSPIPVQAMAVGMPKLTQINGGVQHTCALGVDNSVWCWGGNGSGQLGNGQLGSESHTPVKASNITSASAVVSGQFFSCAIDSGGAKCWGDNFVGELGNGTSSNSGNATPTAVINLTSGVTAIAAGNATACAIDSAGAVQCWGSDDSGQLGNGKMPDGNNPSSPTPGPMMLPAGVTATAVAVGAEFTCALGSDQAVYCAGANDSLQLGSPHPPQLQDDSEDGSNTPLKVPLDVKASQLIAGDRFACAIDTAKPAQLWCWGANDNYELADGTTSAHAHPVHTGYPDALHATAGSHFLCVVSSDGLRCSGFNGFGQLGINRRSTDPTPRQVMFPTGTTPMQISMGGSFSCAVMADQTAMCWGENDRGELGDGTWDERSMPTPVVGLAGVKKIVAGQTHSCALMMDSTVQCWGNNEDGQLGDGQFESRNTPYPVASGVDSAGRALATPLTGAIDIALGDEHTCAVIQGTAANNTIMCWGDNDSGQLGTGNVNGSGTPIAVVPGMMGPTNFSAVAAGDSFTCGIDGAQHLWCWGSDNVDQDGIAQPTMSGPRYLTPVAVTALAGKTVAQVATFAGFACARTTDQEVWCWGFNEDGELGSGKEDFTELPQQIKGLVATDLSVGGEHACAVDTAGAVQCWGADYDGQSGSEVVGGSVYGNSSTYGSVSTLSSGVAAVSTGDQHTCALTGTSVMCFGDDRDGELGIGVRGDTAPVAPLLVCPM